jgi:hypothetical protein
VLALLGQASLLQVLQRRLRVLKPLDDRDVGKHRTNIPLTPNRGHFASWNGTAPLDASSGDQKRHRLSRAGNRSINRVLHIMAIVQMRHDTEGRAYYRRNLAAGKTPMEAIRCLKRRLSDVVYKQMIKDPVLARTGPVGRVGTTLQSSAADPIPMVDTSEQSLPGPAEQLPRTPLLASP